MKRDPPYQIISFHHNDPLSGEQVLVFRVIGVPGDMVRNSPVVTTLRIPGQGLRNIPGRLVRLRYRRPVERR